MVFRTPIQKHLAGRINRHLRDNNLEPEDFQGKEWDLVLAANIDLFHVTSQRLEKGVRECLRSIISQRSIETLEKECGLSGLEEKFGTLLT